jgi:hypothetical protein
VEAGSTVAERRCEGVSGPTQRISCSHTSRMPRRPHGPRCERDGDAHADAPTLPNSHATRPLATRQTVTAATIAGYGRGTRTTASTTMTVMSRPRMSPIAVGVSRYRNFFGGWNRAAGSVLSSHHLTTRWKST